MGGFQKKEYFSQYYAKNKTRYRKANKAWRDKLCPSTLTIDSILLALGGSEEGFGLQMKEEK